MPDSSEVPSEIAFLPTKPAFAEFLENYAKLVKELSRFDLAKLVPVIAGLLTSPNWQASALRLEVLQHLAVVAAQGGKDPKPFHLKSWLTDLGGGVAGRMEDPAEDVFVSRVILPNRDSLLFEGIYETSAFYVQRFLNVLQRMPRHEPFAGLQRSVDCLLRLSQAVALRAGVKANMVGEVIPVKNVTYELLEGLPALAARTTFSREELEGLGIGLEDLRAFIFKYEDRNLIRTETLGYSTLERHPVLDLNGSLCLALPTAVSIAIRRMVIEFCVSADKVSALSRAYAQEMGLTFEGVGLLGGSPVPAIPFAKRDGIYVANIGAEVDSGRILHLCFFVDDFGTYPATGMAQPSPNDRQIATIIDNSIASMHKEFSHKPDFREGLSLLVMCPWGRPVAFGFNGVEDKRWRCETISAADLETISWITEFSPLVLWRLLDSRDRLQEIGVEIINQNGLLNLYAWLEQLKGHLVPHEAIEDDHNTDKPLIIGIPQNGLLSVRKEGAETWNLHHAVTWDGRSVNVRRETPKSFFEKDYSPPLYISVDDLRAGILSSVFEADRRGWWTQIETPNSQDRDLHYRLWHLTTVWISRAAPILEKAISELPEGALAWISRFEDFEAGDPGNPIPTDDEARALLGTKAEGNVIRTNVGAGFLASFRKATNVGERLLVESLIAGALSLGGQAASVERVTKLLREIVPDEWARDMHMFETLRFRNFVQDKAPAAVLISKIDDAHSRIGLGWRKRARSEGPRIDGVDACCTYLNGVVDGIWEDIQRNLRAFNREKLLVRLVENHESISIETDRWLRTARAILSLNAGTPDAALASVRQISKFNGGKLSTRLVAEMALCECPEGGGRDAGTIDIARFMANAMQIHYLGGWSEAIKYGSKKAEIRIMPLGDVHTEVGFDEAIVTPYGTALGTKRFRQGASSYEEHFEKLQVVEEAEGSLDDEFKIAWTEHFRFTIDDLRLFIDNIEDEGIKRRALWFKADFAELAALNGVQPIEAETVRRILDAFALTPRPTWASTPEGFLKRDWYPWRFRRRLSLISRPMIQLSSAGKPHYLVAPGLFRDGATKVIDYCLSGGYDAKDFPPGRMRSWIGAIENRRGHEFNHEVADRLKELGWQAKPNVVLPAILQEKLDRDYGDIDVLAWKESRVLVIECKDLELAMTAIEIARQLHDFRGEVGVNGKPDRLKKHLMRVELLKNRASAVAKYTGSTAGIEIESYLMFSDIVPMTFSETASRHDVRLAILDDAEKL